MNARLITFALLTTNFSVAAADHIVGPGGLSLSAASAAASPGDRILLASDVLVDRNQLPSVPADLTFESMPGGPRREMTISAFFAGSWTITAAVTFRNVRIVCSDPDGIGPGYTPGNLDISAPGGSVRFFDTEVEDRLAANPSGGGTGSTLFLVRITAREVLISGCAMEANDGVTFGPSGIGFCSINYSGGTGTDALRVNASRIVIEDTVLSGGDAPIVCPTDGVGPGGSALVAQGATTFVRCILTDGDGGYQEHGTPPYSVPMAPTLAGQSNLGAVVHASATTVRSGLDGSQSCCRQTRVIGDAEAPLRASGGDIGGVVTIALAAASSPAAQAAGFLIGAEFLGTAVPSPFGTLQTQPLVGVSLPNRGSITLPTTMNASAVGCVFVFQAVLTTPLRLGNPSFVELHL